MISAYSCDEIEAFQQIPDEIDLDYLNCEHILEATIFCLHFIVRTLLESGFALLRSMRKATEHSPQGHIRDHSQHFDVQYVHYQSVSISSSVSAYRFL